MEIKPKFPDHRLNDPKRQAELAVYRDLEASEFPGMTLYSVRPGVNAPELDFLIWLEGIARINLEVKGGPYFRKGSEWFLQGPGGAMPKSNPLMQAWDGAMALRNFLGERLGPKHQPFVIAAVVFTDMDPSPDIMEMAAGAKSHVLWGTGDIAGRLAGIAAKIGVKVRPDAEDIERETALFPEGQSSPEAAGIWGGDGCGLDPRQVVIQHVDTVNIYTTGLSEL